MRATSDSAETGSREPPRRRRRITARRLLILLLLFNVCVLVAFAVDRRSRTDAEFCAGCHNMTTHVDSYMTSEHMDSVHRRARVGCKDCHAEYTIVDELRSVVAYAMGDYEQVFHRRKFSDVMCTGCHIGIEFQATRTDFLARNPHRGHYPDLRCTACHLAHARQVDYCGRCHDNGGQRLTGEPRAVRARAPWETTWPAGQPAKGETHESH